MINRTFFKFSVHNNVFHTKVAVKFHGTHVGAVLRFPFVTLPEDKLRCCSFGCHDFASYDVLSLLQLLTLKRRKKERKKERERMMLEFN